MLPDYRAHNPYQDQLARHLRGEGVTVEFPSGYKRGLHFRRILGGSGKGRSSILHLHWPDPYLRGKSRLMRLFYAWKLRLDLSLALRGSRKLAWTVHNLGSHDSRRDPVEQSFYLWLARRASVLFVHDDSLVSQVSTRLKVSPEKVTVIPHGHYRGAYGPAPGKIAARETLGLPLTDRIALFLGMLRPYKGLEELLNIWPDLHQAGTHRHLVIVGGGFDAAYIQHIQQLCREIEGVTLVPQFIEDTQIPLYYGAADLAVFPFRMITTSGSLILALSYNCPVVTPRVSSTAGHLEFQSELLYDPGSKDGLKAAMQKGLEFDAETCAPAYEHLKTVYSWEKAAQLTAAAYRNCLTAELA